jgi:predicted NBD/HSP70 family sugar kinase
MRNLEETLLWEIFYHPQVARSELARLFNVSAATISRSSNLLLARRLILETGASSASRGRRPTLLRVNPELARVAGIELDRDRITAVISDLGAKLLGRGAIAASVGDPVRTMVSHCRKAMSMALADAGLRSGEISRIGVGHTGTLDVEHGLCLAWEGAPHWRRVNLLAILRKTFKTEITLDDRARAVALVQYLLWPESRRHRSAIYVHIGTGVGAGIFVNGRLLRGVTLAGGEIGHMVIDRNGPPCACGRRGCVEAFSSLGATMARVRQGFDGGAKTSLRRLAKSASQLSMDMVVAAARDGDPLARTALTEAADALAIGIANAVQLLNPSLVVLAGKFANAAREFFLTAVTRTIRGECFETLSRALEIRMAPFRKDAGPIGCALLAAHDVVADLIQRSFFVPAS